MNKPKKSEVLEIGSRIAVLQRFHRRFITAFLTQHDLPGSMHMILFTLRSRPGVSQDYLANKFNLDKGIVARQCKTLESRGLIRREINENDRRQYCLHLTEEGEKLVPVILDGYRGWTDMICKGFSEEEVSMASQLLARMVENCTDVLGEI